MRLLVKAEKLCLPPNHQPTLSFQNLGDLHSYLNIDPYQRVYLDVYEVLDELIPLVSKHCKNVRAYGVQVSIAKTTAWVCPASLFTLKTFLELPDDEKAINLDGSHGFLCDGSVVVIFGAMKMSFNKQKMDVVGSFSPMLFLEEPGERKCGTIVGVLLLKLWAKRLYGVDLHVEFVISDHAAAFYDAFLRAYMKVGVLMCPSSPKSNGPVPNVRFNLIPWTSTPGLETKSGCTASKMQLEHLCPTP